MRTITITYEDGENLYSVGERTETRDLFTTIGYLSTWSESKYPIVNLSVYSSDSGTEIIAAYRTETGAMAGYVLVAVWDAPTRKFTVHS